MSTVVSPVADAVVVRHDSSVVVARKNGGTTVVNQPQRTSAFVVRGVPGLPGPAGERGATGSGLALKGALSSPVDLPLTSAAGDAYLIAGDLWVFGDTAWTNAGPVQGPQGPPGPPGPQGVQGPVGTIDNAGVLTKPMKLSEFDTPTLKAEARANLELEYIDCGTFN